MPFDGAHLSSTTQALIEGRRQIEIGWCQHKAVDGSAVCMVSALPRVRGSFHPAAVQILTEVVGCYPPLWQDMPGRTLDEVLAAYDRAIELPLSG